MRILRSRTILFLTLMSVISRPGMAATLNTGSLQGSYSFAFNKVDTPVLGFFFINAFGTITFDGSGGAAVQGAINRNGDVQALSATGTYTLDSEGRLQLSVPNLPMDVSGSVSFDLNSLLATTVAVPNALTQETLLAVRQPAQPMELSSLTGRYFLVQQTITGTGATPQRENSSGTINFDGAGSYTLAETVNRGGSISTINSSGAYQVTAGGTVTLSLTGRPSPVTLAFAPGAGFGVGTTVSEASGNTHDLFVLTKADSAGLGNAGLGGAHQVVVNAVDSMGFSTSMGRALYFGDGRAFYELRQNRMGVLGTAEENSTVEVAANGEIRLSSIPNVTGLSQGGLGLLGHNVAAAAVGDPAVHSFLVAIRTPSQPAAASNAASFAASTALSPGALVSLFGTNLARQTVLASSLPLPKQMGGATVKINGIEASLHFVSPFQINAQVPFEVSPGAAEIAVALDAAEGSALQVLRRCQRPGDLYAYPGRRGGWNFPPRERL